jgi:DNA polymerase III delta subunit
MLKNILLIYLTIIIKILINYLEKMKLMNKYITLEDAQNICTNINFILFDNYINYIYKNNLQDAVKILYDIYDKGYSVIDILDNLYLYIKITNLISEEYKYEVISIICKYIIIFHNIHEHEIELALLTNNLSKLFSSNLHM